MNRRHILALLAAMSILAAVCAAVPHLAKDAAEIPSVLAGETQPAPATQEAVTTTRSATESHAAQMREHAEQTRGTTAYVTLFIILLLSGLGLPLPEEVPLLLAGYLARHQAASLYVLIPVALAGALSADLILFMAAKKWRSHIFRLRWVRATIRPRHLVFARRQFHNHGLKIVIVARWLPALRTAICLTAGLTGVKPWRFVLVDATAACITVPTSILLGYFLAEHIDRLIAGIVRAEHLVLVGVLAAVGIALLIRLVWWRRSQSPDKLAKPRPPQDGEDTSTENLTKKPGRPGLPRTTKSPDPAP